jgi:hypothetical protein
MDSRFLKPVGQGRDWHLQRMLAVSWDGECAQGRIHSIEHSVEGIYSRRPINQVAGYHEQISLYPAQFPCRNTLEAAIPPHMRIREVADSEAVEGFGKTGNLTLDLAGSHSVRLDGDGIERKCQENQSGSQS